jgi:hypothetical protein
MYSGQHFGLALRLISPEAQIILVVAFLLAGTGDEATRNKIGLEFSAISPTGLVDTRVVNKWGDGCVAEEPTV